MGISYKEDCLLSEDKEFCGNTWQETQQNKGQGQTDIIIFGLLIFILVLSLLFVIHLFLEKRRKKKYLEHQISEHAQSSKSILPILFFMIIVALISGGGVYIWQQDLVQSLKNNLEIRNSNLQNKVQQDQSEVVTLKGQIDQGKIENTTLKNEIADLKEKIAELESYKDTQLIKTEENSTSSTKEDIVVKFEGTITDVNNSCWNDGICSVEVDEKWWIPIVKGGLMPPGDEPEIKGQVEGVVFNKESESIGKKVEINAKKINEESLTIFGSEEYYIRVISE